MGYQLAVQHRADTHLTRIRDTVRGTLVGLTTGRRPTQCVSPTAPQVQVERHPVRSVQPKVQEPVSICWLDRMLL